jgi:predicted dehydrogenase
MVAGGEPEVAHYSAILNEKGYDASGSGCLKFPGGFTMHFGTGVHLDMKNDARIYGTNGWIDIESPWKCYKGAKMTVHAKGAEPEVFEMGITNDELYGYEADAVAEFIEAGECPYMSVADTLGQMKTLDTLRASTGLRFEAALNE